MRRADLAVAGALLAAVLIVAAPAFAQGRPQPQAAPRVPRPPRFDLTLGGGLLAGRAVGEAQANLRGNATTPQDYALFSTDTTRRPSAALNLRVAGVVSGRFGIEGQLLVARPTVETVVSGDAESAPDVTLRETLTETAFGGGVRVRLDDVRRPTRVRPFVTAGAGVLRQTVADAAAETRSAFYYLGGGVQYALGARPAGIVRRGIRADVQALFAKDLFSADDSLTPRVAVTGGIFFAF